MSPKISVALCFALLFATACSSTDENPASIGGFEPDLAAPMVGSGEVPEQQLLDPNRIVARVNEEIITVRSIQAEFGEALASIGEPTEERVRMALDRFALEIVIGRLFVQAAKRLGVEITREELDGAIADAEESVLKERGTTLDADLAARGIPRWEEEERIRRRLLISKFLRLSVGTERGRDPNTRPVADVYVRPKEVRAFYDRNPDQFRQEESARVGAVFVKFYDFQEAGKGAAEVRQDARRFAEGVVVRARRGEDFGKIVKEVQGEPLPQFAEPFKRGTQVSHVEEFAWKVDVGDVSDPIELRSGFLVLVLIERSNERILPFDEVKDEISRRFRMLKFTAAQLKVQSELLRESVVEPPVFKEELRLRFQEQTTQILAELSK